MWCVFLLTQNIFVCFLLSVGDEWYLCRLTLTLPNLSDLQWAMFPYPYLAAVGPDTGAGSVVYKLVARSGDGSVGTAHFILVDGGFDGKRKTVNTIILTERWPTLDGKGINLMSHMQTYITWSIILTPWNGKGLAGAFSSGLREIQRLPGYFSFVFMP